MNHIFAKATIAILAGFIGCTCFPSSASAQITNGSFETTHAGDGFHISDWSVTGGAAALTSNFGDSPTDGTYQAFITNDNVGSTAVYGVSGDNIDASVSAVTLATSIGSTVPVLNGLYPLTSADDGSAITQTITAVAGETLSFDYNFLTQEDPNSASYGADYNDDFSFVSLDGNVYGLADSYTTNNTGIVEPLPGPFTESPSNTDYLTETGYQTYDLTITKTGAYTLAFGVVNGLTGSNTSGANEIDSSLLIDNVQLNAPAAAPEVSSGVVMLILCACTILTLTAVKLFRKSNSIDGINA